MYIEVEDLFGDHQIAIRSVCAQPEKNLPMWARFLSGTAHGEEDLVKNTP
jgi:hypothetical protein